MTISSAEVNSVVMLAIETMVLLGPSVSAVTKTTVLNVGVMISVS